MPTLRAYKPIFEFDEKLRPLPVNWDCIFELESSNIRLLWRFINAITEDWYKEGFVAFDFDGYKEQYLRKGAVPGKPWKKPMGKEWRQVEEFATDYDEVAFSVWPCPFYAEARQTRSKGLML